jgi:quercetin dioxygenase-like cupin family protein
VLAHDLAAPTVVRLAALEPRWTTSRATEPGYFRWLVSYLGGPPGFINPSPESSVTSDRVVAGVMGIPAGNRQHGYHTHTVAEIYVVLRGTLRSWGPGTDHVAGPLDCVVIPAGVAHGVKAVGDEDVLFLWFHDALEPEGVAVYYETPDEAPPAGAEIHLVPWESLPVTRDDGEGGFVHRRRRWTGDAIAIESVELETASSERPRVATVPEVAVVIAGEATLRGAGDVRLGLLDAVVIPPGVERALAAGALAPAHLVVVS